MHYMFQNSRNEINNRAHVKYSDNFYSQQSQINNNILNENTLEYQLYQSYVFEKVIQVGKVKGN